MCVADKIVNDEMIKSWVLGVHGNPFGAVKGLTGVYVPTTEVGVKELTEV